jgi:hypothetical protein
MATVELPAAGMAGMLPPRNATAQVAPGNNFSNPASVVCYSPMMVTARGGAKGRPAGAMAPSKAVTIEYIYIYIYIYIYSLNFVCKYIYSKFYVVQLIKI